MGKQTHRTCVRMSVEEYSRLMERSKAAGLSANAWLMEQLTDNRPVISRDGVMPDFLRLLNQRGRDQHRGSCLQQRIWHGRGAPASASLPEGHCPGSIRDQEGGVHPCAISAKSRFPEGNCGTTAESISVRMTENNSKAGTLSGTDPSAGHHLLPQAHCGERDHGKTQPD